MGGQWKDGWIGGWMDRGVAGWMMVEWMDGGFLDGRRMERWMGAWVDGRTDLLELVTFGIVPTSTILWYHIHVLRCVIGCQGWNRVR